MKILFLDDSMYRWDSFKKRIGNHDVKWASFYDEGVRLVCEEKNYDMIFLDHDLSEASFDAPTGYDFVKYMVANNIQAKYIVCHSMNPNGRSNMASYLKNAGYNVKEVNSAWLFSPDTILDMYFNYNEQI